MGTIWKEDAYLFEWANGSEITKGKNYIDACSKIAASRKDIVTGLLVRVRCFGEHGKKWHYWDAEEFWKILKSRLGGK